MNNWRLLFFVSILGFFVSQKAQATHLVGGELGYEQIGETFVGSGVYTYRVYMNFYLNCGANSIFDSFFDLLGQNIGTPLPVGIYIQDENNPTADKVQLQELDLFLVDTTVIQPNLPAGCGVGQGLCTVQGTFEAFVDLPLNFGGYHLYFQMCCRNLSITNLANPNGTGIGYYAFVPPPLIENSSPIFLGLPTPFLCVGDTSTFLNSAVDPDGDQLVFSFETPYSSFVLAGGIINPPNIFTQIIPTVGYNPGFSESQPFGAGGSSFINAVNGLTEYSSPMQGNFIVAVEVREFRNGILIGISRRDLQLQVITCPPNSTPVLDVSTQQIAYSVDAGDQLCFDAEFDDANGDSLFLVAAGSIFDTLQFNPAATIQAPISGVGSINSRFCWTPGCDQGQSQPYLFSLSVSDNGCPPKNLDVVYEITVNGFEGPAAITGSAAVCEAASAVMYAVQDVGNGATYQWSVTGGTINGTATDTIVSVDWGSSSSGQVTLVTLSQFGCSGDTLTLPVTINSIPAADAGSDQTICEGQSIVIGGSPTGPPGSTFSWNPSATLSSPVAAIPTASPSVDQEYVVTVTNNGCIATDTVVVFVAQVNADAGPSATICVGDSAQLTGTGGATYNWMPNSNIIDGNTATPTVFPTVTTTYFLDLVDANNCPGVDSVVVVVNDLPIVSAGSDTVVCPGGMVALGGSPTGPIGSTFSWNNAATLNNAASANPVATPVVSTTYTVSVVDGNQCVNTDDVVVNISSLPTINGGSDLSVCLGDSVQLNATGASNYSWTPIATLSDPNIPDPFASPTTTTTYTVSTTDANLCSNSDDVTVTVFTPPVANAGNDISLCVGDTTQLNATGGSTYVWSPATDISAANIADPMAFPSSTQIYTVIVTDTNNCVASDDVTVTVNPLPVVSAGVDTVICAGDMLILGGSPTGPAGSVFTWNNAGTLNNAGSANPIATPGANTTYTVSVMDANQCVNTDEVVVNVNALPAINAGTDLSICPGDSIQLNATGAANYAWTPIGALNDPNIADPFASPVTTTTYTVSTTDGNLCTGSDDVIVTVFAAPAVNAGTDIDLCIGDTAQLNAIGGGTYVWSPAVDISATNIPDPVVFPSSTQLYTVTVTDTNNCIASDDVTVTVNSLPSVNAGSDVTICEGDAIAIGGSPTGPAGSTYNWSPAMSLDNAGAANPNASPDSTTTYTVLVTDGNTCMNGDQVTVTVNPLPFLEAGNDTVVCMNGSVQLGAVGIGTFSWSPAGDLNNPAIANPIASPMVTTTYTVSLTGANNCTSSDDVLVDVLPLPTADAGVDVWVCPGFSTNLQASGGVDYSWSPGISLNDSLIADPDATPLANTVYIVTVADVNGCMDTDSVSVVVNGAVPLDAGADVSICSGDSIQLGGAPTSVAGSQFSWQPASSLSDSSTANPFAFPSTTTTYLLTVTNDTCANTDQVTVTIQGNAQASFTAQFEPRCDGMRAWFFNQSVGATDFLWDFGGGATSTEENPTFVFPSGQPFAVTLVVSDGSGCSSSVSQSYSSFNFLDFVDIELPNVFSPNGDGENDVFAPISNVLLGPCAEFSIFNRWGSRVFTSTGGNIAWSGFTFAGEPAIEGTYFYTLVVEGLEFNGSVSLIR